MAHPGNNSNNNNSNNSNNSNNNSNNNNNNNNNGKGWGPCVTVALPKGSRDPPPAAVAVDLRAHHCAPVVPEEAVEAVEAVVGCK